MSDWRLEVPGVSNWCLEVEEEVERRRLAGRARTLADPCCPATCKAPARQMIQWALPELLVPAASKAEQERLRDTMSRKEEDKRKETLADTKKYAAAGPNTPEAKQCQEAEGREPGD